MIDKRMMYAQGQRVTKTLDGSRPGYRGDGAYQGGSGAPGSAESSGDTGNDGNDGNDGNGGDGPNYNAGPDQIVGPVATNLDVKEQYGLGNPVTLSTPIVPAAVSPPLEAIRKNNIVLSNQLKNYKPKTLFPGLLNIFHLGTPGNIDYFRKNSIGGVINPVTQEPYGYGIDGFKDYMRNISLGNVHPGGEPLTPEELRNKVGGGDGGNNNTGIMTVENTVSDDADGDGDVDQDDFIFRYFDKTGETLQAGAGGVQDLMTQIRKRISNIFS
jgi:hypothetical protein